jgi:hypothetical protein
MLGLRLASHRRFQSTVLALVVVGAGGALLAVAARLPAVTLVAGQAVVAVALAFTAQGRERSRGLRALLAVPAVLACGLAAACFLPWAALSSGAMLAAGPFFGLVSSLGLLPAHLVRYVPDRIELAFAALRGGSEDAARALAMRAQAAFRRLEARLRHTPGAESRRLVQLAEAGALQACALAQHGHELAAEILAVGPTGPEERQARLRTRLAATNDSDARRSLLAACAEAREIDARASALATAAERIEARLELQVTLLEGTALAVALRRASEEAGEAELLAPLCQRLREAGIELQAEAQALTELGV